MDKLNFLTKLSDGLSALPYSDRKEIISDYDQHFMMGMAAGKSEYKIAAELGDPYDIAEQFVEEYAGKSKFGGTKVNKKAKASIDDLVDKLGRSSESRSAYGGEEKASYGSWGNDEGTDDDTVYQDKNTKVKIGKGGMYVKTKKSEVVIDGSGIHVTERDGAGNAKTKASYGNWGTTKQEEPEAVVIKGKGRYTDGYASDTKDSRKIKPEKEKGEKKMGLFGFIFKIILMALKAVLTVLVIAFVAALFAVGAALAVGGVGVAFASVTMLAGVGLQIAGALVGSAIALLGLALVIAMVTKGIKGVINSIKFIFA